MAKHDASADLRSGLMTEWHFFEPVYRRWVVLMIGPFEDFKEEMRLSEYHYVDDMLDAKGMCIDLNPTNNKAGQYAFVVWLKTFNEASLVHELSHLVMFCFTQIGVPISQDNTEAFAFYLEYWHTEMLKVRRRLPNGRSPTQAKHY